MNTQPTISYIVPCYNAEKYIERCIKSVINQEIGFQKHIELIIINDGSTDGSNEICTKYAEKYPDNIKYVVQENAGVSAARNHGISLATGKIISFIDADDCISRNASGCVNNYFKITRDYVDVAVISVENFGAMKGGHYANGKFKKGTRTVDIREAEWCDICSRCAQAFFLADSVKNLEFDPTITLFEDTKFVNEVLAKKKRLGIVGAAKYFYRRYENENESGVSLTTGASKNKRLFLDSPKKVSLYLLENVADEETALYYQYTALAEMRWRTFYIPKKASEILSSEEYAEYCETNRKILSLVSDQAIVSFNLYNFWQKVYLLNMKHEKNILAETVMENGAITWNGYALFDTSNLVANILDITESDDCCYIEGYLIGLVEAGLDFYGRTESDVLETVITKYCMDATTYVLENDSYKHSRFKITVPIGKDIKEVSFAYKAGDTEVILDSIGISKLGNPEHLGTHVFLKKCIVCRKKNTVNVYKRNLKNSRMIKRGIAKRKRKGNLGKLFVKMKKFAKKAVNKIFK